ncbi:MAG: SRPBCC family protein [Acidobacteriaceae bacterium]
MSLSVNRCSLSPADQGRGQGKQGDVAGLSFCECRSGPTPAQCWPERDTPFTLEREQWVPASLDDVFAFFADVGNLELLTPEWLRFQILTPQPIAMASGTLIDYRLHWHGIPMRWRTKITPWQPPQVFEDLQFQGPYNLWRHIHRFQAVDGGTLIGDCVRYSLPFGILGRMAHALSVRQNVEKIFEFREQRVRELFGGDISESRRG